MAARKILVGVLMMVMVSPVWGDGKPLGSITSSSDATVRGTKLTAGSTIFMGDVISVAERGGARIALTDGAQVEALGDSTVRLVLADNKIQMLVDRGKASFRTSGSNGLSAVVGDATVRPADGAETSAVIQSLSETHAIVAAEKGRLLVTTAHDGKVYTVAEGQAADLSAVSEPGQGGGAAPAGKAAPPLSVSKKDIYWTLAIAGGGATIAAIILARREAKLSSTELGNEISPAKF